MATHSAGPVKAGDAKDLKEKRMRTHLGKNSSKENLLKYSDVVDYSSSSDEDS